MSNAAQPTRIPVNRISSKHTYGIDPALLVYLSFSPFNPFCFKRGMYNTR